MSAPTGAFDLAYVLDQLRPGQVRHVDLQLQLRSGRAYTVREQVAILAVDPDPVQPDRMVRVLGTTHITDGVIGNGGYRSYPTRFGFGPTLRWSHGDDPDTTQGQWWLGPNGLVGTFTPWAGVTIPGVAEIARQDIAAQEDARIYRAEHRHRRGGREAAAAQLAEEDAITNAAADRDDAIERVTAALRASTLPERRLADLAGLSRMTVRRLIGREPAAPQ